MKAVKNNRFALRVSFAIKCFLLVFIMIGFSKITIAQTGEETKKEVKTDSTATEVIDSSSKKELRMSFDVYKINQELKLIARVRSKVGAKFQNTAGVEVSFYKEEFGPSNFIGKGTSNHKGESYLILPVDTSGETTYLAVVRENPDFEDVEETATSKLSKMDIMLEEEDSSRLVKIFVGHPDETGQIVPMPETECKIYVRRLFGLLPIGDPETTDVDGLISVAFPDSIKGDESGNLTVVAKIEDNEVLGNVEVSKTIAWGVPTKVNDFYLQRELWSARANSPWTLILIVNAALLGIWGVIAFIFLEIFRINKIGKTN